MDTLDANFITTYYERIQAFLKHYDPASLLAFPRTFFDVEVANGRSKTGLPAMLEMLVEQWGSEPRDGCVTPLMPRIRSSR
jgi:hypothetical protein